MTTVAAPARCNRCHRVLRQPSICGYGPKCAARYGLAPERRVRVRRPRASLPEQPSLFDLLGELGNETEINEGSEEPTWS